MKRIKRFDFLVLFWSISTSSLPVSAHESKSNGVGFRTEPIGYTDVIDAFEEDDPFDLNFGFESQMIERSGTIWREERAPSSKNAHQDIAQHTHSIYRLILELEVGLYHDLMFYTRMPFVVSDKREITPVSSDDPTKHTTVEIAGSEAGADDIVIFELPFAAANRTGIPEINLGLAWAITNQFRSRYTPTWVIRLESRVSVGDVLKPSCQDEADDLWCNDSPGISPGYHALRLESRTSYRYRYFEPYFGIAYQIQWAGRASNYFLPRLEKDGPEVSPDEVVNSGPPNEWETVLGVAFVPWEVPAERQRFVIDLQLNAVYVTSGRDYSPLFDVLGTSMADPLAKAQIELVDPDSEGRSGDAPFYGLTDVQSYARFSFRTALILQAARYLRLTLGIGIGFETAHLLTATDKCVGDDESEDADPRCPDGGTLNRNYRDAIDRAGQRFGLGGNLDLDVFTQALGSF